MTLPPETEEVDLINARPVKGPRPKGRLSFLHLELAGLELVPEWVFSGLSDPEP